MTEKENVNAGDGGYLYMPSIATGDFDEDGVLDLAAAVVQRDYVYLLFGEKK